MQWGKKMNPLEVCCDKHVGIWLSPVCVLVPRVIVMVQFCHIWVGGAWSRVSGSFLWGISVWERRP